MPKVPLERPIVFGFRDVLLMKSLLVERLELMGADIPARRASEARLYLVNQTPEELQTLLDKLGDAQVHWDEEPG